MGENARKIELLWQAHDKDELAEESWLVFSKPACAEAGERVGNVEIAFLLDNSGRILSVDESPLVVFFPTIVETHLGFLAQGPYRTTPSRDNVRNDQRNQYLVRETATLLAEALRSLRDLGLLDTGALQSLPLDRTKFGEGQMFAPLFETVRSALVSKPLLPRFDDGHVSASGAKLASTQEMRELFSPMQLGALFGVDGELIWLSGDITENRTPELRQYLMRELGIAEVTPETILPKLGKSFLEAQADDWIVKLYEFLNGQSALRWRVGDLPLIRLEEGTHVPARSDGRPQAFLPSTIETTFPTVCRTVCATDGAMEFLRSLGLTEPDPVDDVVLNVLPKYQAEQAIVSDQHYASDVRRFLAAFETDSTSQRNKLTAALRESRFVKAVDAGDGSKVMAKPGTVYLATERLKGLFKGVGGVLLVDDAYECLRGEEARELLEASGATRYLRSVPVEPDFTGEERQEMRRKEGCERNTGPDSFDDNSLSGLEELLTVLPKLEAEAAMSRSRLLWEALADLEGRGHAVFSGRYFWFYHTPQSCNFNAAFVRQLNETAWIPDANGDLQRPEFVIFDTLGWTPNPFLLSKIKFKPPIIETLAREAGIEPGVLDLLKKLGVTSEAELKKRLGIKEEPQQPGGDEGSEKSEGGRGEGRTGGETGSGGVGGKGAGADGDGQGERRLTGRGDGNDKRTQAGTGQQTFISYVAVHPNEEKADPDGLDQQVRMALEEKAIQFILQREPQLHRTPSHNPGYDLCETGEDEQTIRWVEVKAMTRSLNDRPVGLSRTQFECAREHGEAYWLYVVEHADSGQDARIVRIKDPAGVARTFTFDRGWLSVADIGDATRSRMGRSEAQSHLS